MLEKLPNWSIQYFTLPSMYPDDAATNSSATCTQASINNLVRRKNHNMVE